MVGGEVLLVYWSIGDKPDDDRSGPERCNQGGLTNLPAALSPSLYLRPRPLKTAEQHQVAPTLLYKQKCHADTQS
jgi:hypothetical protein